MLFEGMILIFGGGEGELSSSLIVGEGLSSSSTSISETYCYADFPQHKFNHETIAFIEFTQNVY